LKRLPGDVEIGHHLEPIDEGDLHWARHPHHIDPRALAVQLDRGAISRRGKNAQPVTAGAQALLNDEVAEAHNGSLSGDCTGRIIQFMDF